MDSENTAPSLLLEDVARAAAELNAEAELAGVIARFHERLREWSTPSAVLAAVKDPSSESGWRLLAPLSFGSGPLGVERSIPQLVESAPGCLERPTVVHPQEEVPGVRPRDNCIVPWAHEGDSGILVLRGVPRPSPTNLGEAVAVLSAPVWPRLLGGPVPRIESLLADIRRAAETLGEDVERQLERLRTSRPSGEGPAGDEADASRAAELEQTRQEGQQLQSERDSLKERLLALETALKESETERDQSLAEVKKLSARAESQHSEHATEVAQLVERCRTAEAAARTAEEVRAASQRELDDARAEMEHSTLDWDELKGRVAVLQEALQDAEAERDRVRDEAERLSARIESLQTDQTTALEKVERGRKTAEAAAQTAQDDLAAVSNQLESLKKATAAQGGDQKEDATVLQEQLNEQLREALTERDRARSEVGQLSGRIESMESGHKEALDDLDEKRRGAVAEAQMARNETAAAQKELEEARQAVAGEAQDPEAQERLTRVEAELKDARAERDRAREESKRAAGELEDAMAELKAAQEDLTRARQDLGAAAASRHTGDIAREPIEAASPEGGARALETLRSTLSVLKRTPFVAPGLRVSIQEGEALVTGKDEGIEKWLRVAILDRDAASLEPLADELEAAGLDVRVANYPEELALLMKTPDAKELGAVVCDILAFRPDQTVAGLFRGWEKDRPGLSFFLAFSPDDPAETERASRVPQSLTTGRLSRPIASAELIEKLQVMVQRQNSSKT